MKKIIFLSLSLILCLVSCILLTACYHSYYYDYDELKDRIIKIEIVKINNENSERSYLIAETIKVLNDEEMDEMLLGISKINFKFYHDPATGVSGICIKLWCKNGDYEVIGESAVRVFNSKGEAKTSYYRNGGYTLKRLISKFIDLPAT